MIRSLSCKFALLVTSGLKITPRCSECREYVTSEQSEMEVLGSSRLGLNIRAEESMNREIGLDEKWSDEEECSDVDEFKENKNDLRTFGATKIRSQVSLVPNDLDRLKKMVLASLLEDNAMIKDIQSLSERNGHKIQSHGHESMFNEKCDTIEDVSRNLPSSVTVTKVPKDISYCNQGELLVSSSHRKNKDVIVTSGGVVRETDNCPSLSINNRIEPQKNGYFSRTSCSKYGNRITKKLSKSNGKRSHILRKSISSLKINETCKICLHHFTVKQAFERDKKVRFLLNR